MPLHPPRLSAELDPTVRSPRHRLQELRFLKFRNGRKIPAQTLSIGVSQRSDEHQPMRSLALRKCGTVRKEHAFLKLIHHLDQTVLWKILAQPVAGEHVALEVFDSEIILHLPGRFK